MARCPTCGATHRECKTLTAFASTADSVGSCNFCDRHISIGGLQPHAVLVLGGAGLQARLCQHCAHTLWPTLRDFANMTVNASGVRVETRKKTPKRERYRRPQIVNVKIDGV